MVKHTQFASKLLTNCLSVFDHFVGLALKGLRSCKNCVSFSRLEKLGFLVYKLLTNCLSWFDHFVGLALKGLRSCKNCVSFSRLEKLGFLVYKSLCSSNQVQENVHLIILCSLSLYKVHVFATSCTSLCTKWNRLWKDRQHCK